MTEHSTLPHATIRRAQTVMLMSNATATKDGYTSTETSAYSPTSGGSPTVGAGTNQYSAYCGALNTAGLTAAAAACQSDTAYACTYDSANHTVSCPAQTVTARPPSSAWDIGAWEYNTQDPPPNAPTGLTAIVQCVKRPFVRQQRSRSVMPTSQSDLRALPRTRETSRITRKNDKYVSYSDPAGCPDSSGFLSRFGARRNETSQS